jgi:hypothetical protein
MSVGNGLEMFLYMQRDLERCILVRQSHMLQIEEEGFANLDLNSQKPLSFTQHNACSKVRRSEKLCNGQQIGLEQNYKRD